MGNPKTWNSEIGKLDTRMIEILNDDRKKLTSAQLCRINEEKIIFTTVVVNSLDFQLQPQNKRTSFE